jgi:hypothetical protein
MLITVIKSRGRAPYFLAGRKIKANLQVITRYFCFRSPETGAAA